MILASCGGGSSPDPTPSPSREPSPTVDAFVPTTGTDVAPASDLVDLARRFRGVNDAPDQLSIPAPQVGDSANFGVVELRADPQDPPVRRVISATLAAVSEHGYYFFEGGEAPGSVDKAVATFEDEVWPAVTGDFGTPETPGIDGDARVVLLHADLGPAVAGYVAGADAYPRTVAPLSNQRQAVYLNTNVPLGSTLYTAVLAHEFQHLIHANYDPNEDAWVNEGLSEVAAGLLGSGTAFYQEFLDDPDIPLTDWSLSLSGAHYGASSLFFRYLLEQTGGDVATLVSETADGIAGVEAYLATTDEQRTFEEIVTDWTVANELDRPDGPYGYRAEEVSSAATTEIDRLGADEGTVYPFAADYIDLSADDFPTPPRFVFDGAADTPAVAAENDADGAFWWSSSGDGIDSQLTRELDLTDVSSATLTFRLWYEIEQGFDYAYVSVSTDRGATWSPLRGRHTTDDNPLEISFGPAYTGSSGNDSPGWVNESIDLSAYAGERILVRFEYVTDDGVSGPGIAIDDIAVPETGFLDDAESDAGGWRREGFRIVDEPVPVTFALRLITFADAPAVEAVPLDEANDATIDLSGLGSEYHRAVVLIVGLSRDTALPGRYHFNLQPATSPEEEP